MGVWAPINEFFPESNRGPFFKGCPPARAPLKRTYILYNLKNCIEYMFSINEVSLHLLLTSADLSNKGQFQRSIRICTDSFIKILRTKNFNKNIKIVYAGPQAPFEKQSVLGAGPDHYNFIILIYIFLISFSRCLDQGSDLIQTHELFKI